MNEILVTSLVSSREKSPRVDITINGTRIQLSADEAMDLAKNIIEVCSGSYADSFIVNFMFEKVFSLNKEDSKELAFNKAIMVLEDFREYRDKLALDFKSYQNKKF